MIEDTRIHVLLATKRPAPSRQQEWQARLWALARAERETAEPLKPKVQAEIAAMRAERDAFLDERNAVTTAEARSMETCVLRPRNHGPRTCDGCGGALVGQRRRWCSDACSGRWWDNHAWTSARWEAIRRSSGLTVDQLRDLNLSLFGASFCDECGEPALAPEVNHVEPRVGRGYGPGCHNHQTNLQVLCHGCHVAETTRQTRERLGIPDGGRPRGSTSREAKPEPMWGAA